MPHPHRIVAILALAMLSACASTYNIRARAAHNAFHRGDYDQATRLIDEVKPAPRDRLLHLLDRGMILHGAGRYDESNRALTEAEELTDWLSARSVTKEVAATLWSEEAREYAGEKYERVLIPVIKMLNYIMLDEWDEAEVEVRRLSTTAEKAYGNVKDYDNAFAIYLSAIVWEAMGHINDALIDYRHLKTSGKDIPYLGHDIKETSRRLSLRPELPAEGGRAWEAPEGYRKGAGELIVIVESGRSPYFESDSLSTDLFTFSMPTVMGYASARHATVSIDGMEAGSTHSFHNMADDILEALKDRTRRSFVRKMIKASVQTGLYAAGTELIDKDETEEKIAGIFLILLGFSMSTAESAEVRSWRTLPAEFQIARFYLKPGRHDVEIVPEGAGSPLRETVEIGRERPKVLIAHLPEGATVAKMIGTPEDKHAAVFNQRKRTLLDEIKKRPHDGNLKLELALVKIGLGDYDVEDLLKQSLKEGGETLRLHSGQRRKAIEAIVIASMVKSDYDKAREWSAKAIDERLDGLERFEFYTEAVDYLKDKTTTPPQPPLPYPSPQQEASKASNISKEVVKDAQDVPSGAAIHFVTGLMDEKVGRYEEATREYAAAYSLGLTGDLIAKQVMECYKLSPSDFKESDEGIKIVSDFANSYLRIANEGQM